MNEHAAELLQYLMPLLAFLAIMVLNGIKSEIKDVKTTINKIEGDLRGSLSGLDRRVDDISRRVGHIEGRCENRNCQD